MLSIKMKILFSAMILSMGISLPIHAGTGENSVDFEFDYQAAAVMLSDYLVTNYKVDELVEKKDCEVKIYNENNDLVRFGKANNGLVINLINKSDFLMRIDDTKYYRLNK
ncbi:MAG: hypothetical protein KFF73_12975 [Cyclobacteriaceae bacterium]|nr:hypothetical protein [Cyclobacteriaceae bacterium]